MGYGFEGYTVDETDLTNCLDVNRWRGQARTRRRPPQLVVAPSCACPVMGNTTMRVYVTDEIKREPFARDCLKVAEQTIVDLNLADTEALAEWRRDAAAQVESGNFYRA